MFLLLLLGLGWPKCVDRLSRNYGITSLLIGKDRAKVTSGTSICL